MSEEHANLNRPVHLARRDVFFEHAADLIGQPLADRDAATRLQTCERIQACLKKARQHAFFAMRSASSTPREEDFLHFMDLVIDHADSAHAMIQHQIHLGREESFLCQFLGIEKGQNQFPAMHYQRRSEDIHQELWHLFRLAQQPYSALRQTNITTLDEEDRERYNRAYKMFRAEAAAKFGAVRPGSPSSVSANP